MKASIKNPDEVTKADRHVFQKSEKPRNKRSKNEEIIQAIIEKDRQKGDDIAILEAEMLAAGSDHDEDFQPLLPDLSGLDKGLASNNDWKDVDSDQILGAEEDSLDGHDLIGDPNISAIGPPFDSENKKCENANGTSSKFKNKTKLNCTVPKNMAGFWNDSKRLNLK